MSFVLSGETRYPDLNAELTPSEQYVRLDAAPFRKDGHKDEHVQVKRLDEDPHVIAHQRVHEERNQSFTLPVLQKKAGRGHTLRQEVDGSCGSGGAATFVIGVCCGDSYSD